LSDINPNKLLRLLLAELELDVDVEVGPPAALARFFPPLPGVDFDTTIAPDEPAPSASAVAYPFSSACAVLLPPNSIECPDCTPAFRDAVKVERMSEIATPDKQQTAGASTSMSRTMTPLK
jgi:hypothetical protein